MIRKPWEPRTYVGLVRMALFDSLAFDAASGAARYRDAPVVLASPLLLGVGTTALVALVSGSTESLPGLGWALLAIGQVALITFLFFAVVGSSGDDIDLGASLATLLFLWLFPGLAASTVFGLHPVWAAAITFLFTPTDGESNGPANWTFALLGGVGVGQAAAWIGAHPTIGDIEAAAVLVAVCSIAAFAFPLFGSERTIKNSFIERTLYRTEWTELGGALMLAGAFATATAALIHSAAEPAGPVGAAEASALLFAFAIRLPLYPLEAVWALLRGGRRLAPSGDPEALLSSAYFDRKMMLPLPGEANAHLVLQREGGTTAIDLAIDTARYSNRLIAPIQALQRLAARDPLGVAAQIASHTGEAERRRPT